MYIGQSVDIEQRWRAHRHSFKYNTAPIKLQEAYNVYGEPRLYVLKICDSTLLDMLETKYILEYNSREDGFNRSSGGSTGNCSGLIGELNGRSIYSNDKVLEVFELLKTTHYSYLKIAEICNVSKEMVGHIVAGITHAWVKEQYPEEFQQMLEFRRTKPAST